MILLAHETGGDAFQAIHEPGNRHFGRIVHEQTHRCKLLQKRFSSAQAEADEKLHWVHVLVWNAKAFIAGTYHGLDKKHLPAYLDEFGYRFNRRIWQPQLFGRVLNACVSGPIVSYQIRTSDIGLQRPNARAG